MSAADGLPRRAVLAGGLAAGVAALASRAAAETPLAVPWVRPVPSP